MLVIANTLFQQPKRRLHTWTSPKRQYWNQIDYVLGSWRWRSSIQSAKTRPGADCGPDYELLVAKYRLKLKKEGKTTRPFRYESQSQSHSVVSDSLRPCGLYSLWNSLGQNTGVHSLSLFQGIFPTQGLNPGLPHCRQILDQLSYKGSPRILEWVACPFSSESFQPRNWTGVSCIAGRFFIETSKSLKFQHRFYVFFYHWAIREAEYVVIEVKVAKLCPILCDSMDYTFHGILWARILELPFSRGSSQPRDWTQISRIAGRLFPVWATREAPIFFLVQL